MKRILIIAMFGMFSMGLFGQSPEKFNYQAVVRDNIGNPIANQPIDFRFNIRANGTAGTIVYDEDFTNVTTNSYGLVNFQIGSTDPAQFSTIPWGSGTHFLEVLTAPAGTSNYTQLGVQEIVSVAYALYAKDVQNKDDADADPNNEIQSLTLNGDVLSISSGNTVTFDDKVYDGDSSATNELQVLSISGDTLNLSNGGSAVVIPNDQDWTKSGATVYNINDNIGIGTSQPQANLDVVGQMRYEDGNQGAEKILMSDANGAARWDTLADPFTFYATHPNWGMTGGAQSENIYCTATVTLTKRSLVVAQANGHVYASQVSDAIVGIVFPGETLYASTNSVYAVQKLAQLGTPGPGLGWVPVATTRSKVLDPGTHQISLRFRHTAGTADIYLNGASLSGFVIPFN